jgi:hypothetical protein
MAGQPRRRLAHRLAVRMANELRREGPLHVDVLLDRLGYGPLNHEQMSRIERAAERMAVRDVQQVYGARLEPNGRLSLPAGGGGVVSARGQR